MKFKLRDSASSDVEVNLWLENARDGRVVLKGVSGRETRNIMVFQGGRYRRVTNAELEGVYTDDDGRIKEVGEEENNKKENHHESI